MQSELYLGPEGEPGSLPKMQAEDFDAVVFNRYYMQYRFAPIRVEPGERVRAWVIDDGPSENSSFHIVGTQFDTVFKGQLPRDARQPHAGQGPGSGPQPSQGGFVEFDFDEPGLYPIVTTSSPTWGGARSASSRPATHLATGRVRRRPCLNGWWPRVASAIAAFVLGIVGLDRRRRPRLRRGRPLPRPSPPAGLAMPRTRAAIAATDQLVVTATEFAFDPATAAVSAGRETTVELNNDGGTIHELGRAARSRARQSSTRRSCSAVSPT